jgi:hypothetical protein
MCQLIGLVGAKGCGKSTAAEYLVTHHGYVRVRLADGLKNMLRTIGLTHAQVDGDEKEVPLDMLCGRTPRWAMQSLGSEWGRDCIGPDIWANVAGEATRKLLADGWCVVVDDIRFPNEAAMFNQLGGELYRVRRASAEAVPVTHESEKHWPTLPCVGSIENEGSIQDLRHRMATILRFKNGMPRN